MGSGHLDLLIDRMSPIPRAIVQAFIDSCPEAAVIADNVAPDELARTVELSKPDAVILGNLDHMPDEREIAGLVGAPEARRRVVTLFGPDRGARLHEWRVGVTVMTELSLASLRAALLEPRHG